MNKRVAGVILGLVVVTGIGAIATLINGFENNNVTDWFNNNVTKEIEFKSGGYNIEKLNYDESNYYYFESEVLLPSGHFNAQLIGLGNYVSSNEDDLLTFAMDLGDYNWKVKDFKTGYNGDWSLEHEIDNWRLGEYFEKEIPKENDTTIKIATARLGKEYYMFVNNQYVTMVTDEVYSNEKTKPALIAHVDSSSLKFTKIDYVSGQTIVNNIVNKLTHKGSSMITGYVGRGYDWALGSKNTDNKNFKVNDYTDERGLNFDFTNKNTDHQGGMVSTYQYFEGEFTFEFDYKPTFKGEKTDDCKMWLECRPYDYSDEIFWIGTKFRSNDAEQIIKRIKTDEVGEDWDTSTITNPESGMHYKITRRFNENSTICYFDLEITSLTNPSQKVERLNIPYTTNYYDEKMILVWHNTNLAGEFSNIVWKSK